MSVFEERRILTILFADVVASTELLATRDPEQVRAQISRFFDLTLEEVERHGGTVEKYVGDAILAVFGLPTTHEDDPERAVSAALAIQTRIRPHVDANRAPEIRIGVNTGEAIANPKAVERTEFLLTGEAVNLAFRLQQYATPGQIMVGESTYAATQWAFEYRPLPPLQVKGKSEPILCYECKGTRSAPLSRRGHPQGIGSPMVGRDAERAALAARIEEVLTGRGGVLAVIGEAGVGKSRLVAESRRQFAGRRLRWLEGRAMHFGRQISYWPLLEILRSAVGITEEDHPPQGWAKLMSFCSTMAPDNVADIVPYVGTLLGLPLPSEWQERVKYLDGEDMGRQIYRGCRLFFETLAHDRPLVLVFEDLHWIDQSSTNLLEHLLPLTGSVPLLLCGLARPDPETPAAHLREIASRDYTERYTEITLTPLLAPQTVQMASQVLGVNNLPPGLQELILRKSEGNPFFIEEIIRSLIEARAIALDETTDRYVIRTPIDQITTPETIRGVIMGRVDRLDEGVKQVVKTAAVIGRHFFHRVLRAVMANDRDLEPGLVELQRLELIRERRRDPELEYIFKHALIQEAVYKSILVAQRRELHRRVGAAIEALFADHLEDFYGMLAYHYARAEEQEKAQDYLFRAGDQAGRLAADAEALTHYRQAVATYSGIFGNTWGPLQRAVLNRKIGQALYRHGEHELALDYLHQALADLGTPFPATPSRVRVATARELLRQARHRIVRPPSAKPTASDSLVAEERVRLYESMGWIDYHYDLPRLFLDVLLLLNVSEQSCLGFGTSLGSTGLGVISDLLATFGIAESYHRRAVAIAEEIEHPLAIGISYLALAIHEFRTGDTWDQALEHFRRSASAYRGAGVLRQWGAATSLEAWLSRARGDFAYSFDRGEEVIRIGQETGDPLVQGWGEAEVGRNFLYAGSLEDAAKHLRMAIEFGKSVPDYIGVVIAGSNLARCHLRAGRLQEALQLLDDSRHLAAARGFRGYHRSQPILLAADAYLTMMEASEGRERQRWRKEADRACLAAWKHGRVDADARSSAYRFQGTFEWLSGRRHAAEGWWQRSLTVAERLGARYDLGLTHLEMGRRMGARGHEERARAFFGEIGIWPEAR